MNSIKQISSSKQLELHGKYGNFIKDLFTNCNRLRNGTYTKIIKLQYQVQYLFDANVEFEILKSDDGMKLLDFCVWFSGHGNEDKFKGGINVTDSETSNNIIIMLCLNIAEFIDDVIWKNK